MRCGRVGQRLGGARLVITTRQSVASGTLNCVPVALALQDAVEAVGRILGMQACEGTDAVPPNARSHTLLLSGIVVGDVQVLVRLSFGIDAQRNVAMKLAVRSESADVSEAIHAIIQEA